MYLILWSGLKHASPPPSASSLLSQLGGCYIQFLLQLSTDCHYLQKSPGILAPICHIVNSPVSIAQEHMAAEMKNSICQLSYPSGALQRCPIQVRGENMHRQVLSMKHLERHAQLHAPPPPYVTPPALSGSQGRVFLKTTLAPTYV